MAEWLSGPSGTRGSCLLTRSPAPEGRLEAPLSFSAPCRPGVGATETVGSSPAPHRPRPGANAPGLQGSGAPGRGSRREGGSTLRRCSTELLAQDGEGKRSGQISFVSRSVSASLSSTRMSPWGLSRPVSGTGRGPQMPSPQGPRQTPQRAVRQQSPSGRRRRVPVLLPFVTYFAAYTLFSLPRTLCHLSFY